MNDSLDDGRRVIEQPESARRAAVQWYQGWHRQLTLHDDSQRPDLDKYRPEDAMLRSTLKVALIVVVSAVIAAAVLYTFPAALPVRPAY